MNEKSSKRISRWVLLGLDIVLLLIALYISAVMRGGLVMSYTKLTARRVLIYAPLFIADHILWLWLVGSYRVMWMYAELKDMAKLAFACVFATLINLAINAIFSIGYSRYVLGFLGVFGLVLLITSRYLLQLTRSVMYGSKRDKQVKRALIIGADADGIRLAKELPMLDDGARHEAVAFLDEDVDKLYRRIGTLPVEGMYLDAAKVIKTRHIDEVITTGRIAESPAFKGVYLEAARAGCEVKAARDERLDRMDIGEALSSGCGEVADVGALKTGGAAIVGQGELALELARLLINNGIGVSVLGDDVGELKALRQMGAKVCLGSCMSPDDVDEFIRLALPGSVIYLAGIRDRELAQDNPGAAERANVSAPLAALKAAKDAGTAAFVRVTEMLDLPEEAELFGEGEQALLSAGAQDVRLSIVSVRGLLAEGGLIDRLKKNAKENCPSGNKAFISVAQAAAAVINLLCVGLSGRFEIKGEQKLSMADVLRALGGDPDEDQQSQPQEEPADTSTQVKDVYACSCER
ncbi:MAG: hypothetical protein K5663_04790 [Clostridiales bacterium]|nr:hypothetical protein [Clostridiales bacterium]